MLLVKVLEATNLLVANQGGDLFVCSSYCDRLDIAADWAVIVSAIAAFIVVIVTKIIAKRRALIDLIETRKHCAIFIENREKFNKLLTSAPANTPNDEVLGRFAGRSHCDSDEFRAINWMGNQYEMVATGIRTGILDEYLYFRLHRNIVLEDWKSMKPWVQTLRGWKGSKNELFCEFECLAEKWEKIPPWYSQKKRQKIVNWIRFSIWFIH